MSYIACDLDGTLAKYERSMGPLEIGEPIAPMIDRVKRWLSEGREVRIFTARVAPTDLTDVEIENCIAHHASYGRHLTPDEALRDIDRWNGLLPQIRRAIEAWCERHIGQKLPVTHKKDFSMIRLYDDRAVQVEMNTGRLIGVDDE